MCVLLVMNIVSIFEIEVFYYEVSLKIVIFFFVIWFKKLFNFEKNVLFFIICKRIFELVEFVLLFIEV